ncbi:hypothetical protein K458DRAFT_421604 [Lentithecium fluviatile CBS 122367]|uniref:Uncharacterized protein n=1 Tax=Lentithecium fluviatile CBS 122367 TaxID=1168545 RepID=A0A6G1IQX6_9PLEO|nr:hypothetical protein K458DRAFT_421604 [Lentithecium fluviatile CBS 122367]
MPLNNTVPPEAWLIVSSIDPHPQVRTPHESFLHPSSAKSCRTPLSTSPLTINPCIHLPLTLSKTPALPFPISRHITVWLANVVCPPPLFDFHNE